MSADAVAEMVETAVSVEKMRGTMSRPPAGNDHTSPTVRGAIVGVLTRFDHSGEPVLNFSDDNGVPVETIGRTTTELRTEDIGREVLIQCERGNPYRPIVTGLLRVAVPQGSERIVQSLGQVDQKRVYLSAEDELVLRCGDASITLTRAGKVLVRGAYLLSWSRGLNRIVGGSVEIN